MRTIARHHTSVLLAELTPQLRARSSESDRRYIAATSLQLAARPRTPQDFGDFRMGAIDLWPGLSADAQALLSGAHLPPARERAARWSMIRVLCRLIRIGSRNPALRLPLLRLLDLRARVRAELIRVAQLRRADSVPAVAAE